MSTYAKLGLSMYILTAPVHVSAASFTDMFVFGDSFSDIGNVFAATRGLIPPDPPYFAGRFSDGPIWIEHLAERLGTELVPNGGDPNVFRGNAFAAGGARAGIDVPIFTLGTIPSALTQVQAFVAEVGPLSPDALYVVYSGHNDVLLAADVDEPLEENARAEIVLDAVGAIGEAIESLANSGAKSFLVPNIADLGRTPRARLVEGNGALASDLTVRFNNALEARLTDLETVTGATIYRIDVFSLANDVIEDATHHGGQGFGIVNVDMPIFEGFAGSIGADPTASLFADDIHISSKAHHILGEIAFATIPEPSSLALIVVGLLGLVAVVFRRNTFQCQIPRRSAGSLYSNGTIDRY